MRNLTGLITGGRKWLYKYLRLLAECMFASSHLNSYRGLGNQRFRPGHPDRGATQYVFTVSNETFPPRVRCGVDDLDRWLGWGLGNEIFDLRAARSESAIRVPVWKV